MENKKKCLCKLIGAKVKYYRTICGIPVGGLSQADVAQKANLHAETISRLERGDYNDTIPLSTLVDIADALGIEISLLLNMSQADRELIHWDELENPSK
ncbi:helix-turn-helix transcriptional regulator [Acidaminococcus fermentans]|uniref:helix-turn-helix domain-containing protein n=2 Tax=Acidaminococcus TaxID=904 RepID=UPI002E7A49ED|nr:helix-turn-helix transcriptional regulator [Acidaminococcus fermentans]MEE1597592.1 helix-turn-helix transcriptional regulator [Acidaminococcus fermentans]MEE4121854.1 helix-turn-helix transcriptional regulator [Acidaminococcus fermentans]